MMCLMLTLRVILSEVMEIIDGNNNLIQSNGKFTAIIGASNLVVVNTNDAILVVSKDKVEDVKAMVEFLKTNGQQDLT